MEGLIHKLNGYIGDPKREKYGAIFILAFLMSAAAMLIFIILDGGYFTYYGDFNYQQIPFIYHTHEAIRDGRLMWDYATDLGADMIESYAPGSPFFWLTQIFPTAAQPYLIPWIICLKTAVAAVCAYAYIRQLVKNTNACCIGALLYAFSGFQLTNLHFNLFHDFTAFFPLLLLASDKLFIEGKKGFFALTCAVCALANYFLFAGAVVFTVIYFVVNIITGRYRFRLGKFILYAAESVVGTLASSVILLPSFMAILENDRAAETIPLSEMLTYLHDPMIYLYLIKALFVFPDLMVEPIYDVSAQLSCSVPSLYLPFVSLCGVIGYFFLNRKKWDMPKLMLIISGVMAFVPVLNSLFYMFNRQYYSRWFFMPIFIMCVMTAVTAEENTALFKKGIIPCAAVAGLFFAGGLIYYAAGGNVEVSQFIVQSLLTLGALGMLYSLLTDKNITDENARLNGLFKRVGICCPLFMLMIITLGRLSYTKTDEYIRGTLDSADEVRSSLEELQSDKEQYYRVDVCAQFTNRSLMWDTSSTTSFITVVKSSIEEFYEKIGFPRGTTSGTIANYDPIHALLSVKYYFDLPLYNDDGMLEPAPILNNAVESFDYLTDMGGMHVYENNCYIPMGFTFDYYTTDEDFEALDNKFFRSQALLEAMVLDDEAIERNSDILERYDMSQSSYDHEEMEKICERKAQESCDFCHFDKDGFNAEITLDEEKMVFFSVPYDEGWSAYINGEPVRIENASYGFMAVRCGEGTSEIRFSYVNKWTLYGLYISLAAIIILIVYSAIVRLKKDK